MVQEITFNDIKKMVSESASRYLNEVRVGKAEKEQMLVDLYNYLAQEPTDDIYDGGRYGKWYTNTGYKAYNYFEPKGIVHNVWAVHYTNVEGFEGIQSRGFRVGVPELDALAYSRRYYGFENRKNGWNFALPLDNEYLGEDRGYGDCAFLLKTDGVLAYHKGDHDNEIIFKGCMVKKKFPFVWDDDYRCWILFDYGDEYKEGDKLPPGAYYDERLEQVVFKDVRSLINTAISVFGK